VALHPKRLAPATAAHKVAPGSKIMRGNRRRLTSREKEVLAFLTAGKSNAEIAAGLNISPNTVKNHVSSIYLKLDVSNRTEAGLAGLRMLAFSAALPG
jgi:DNA-binding NarL/FixJ family response regulator